MFFKNKTLNHINISRQYRKPVRRALQVAVILSTAIAMTPAAHAQENIIVNPGFEEGSPNLRLGNNINADIGPWIINGDRPNVVRVDGPGGVVYGNNRFESGPQFDAINAPDDTDQRYLDIVGTAELYQSFTVPLCPGGSRDALAGYRISGFFSPRDAQSGVGSMRLIRGNSLAGNPATVAGSEISVNVPRQNFGKEWTFFSVDVVLERGQTFSYVIEMDNGLNFDEASVVTIPGFDCGTISANPDTVGPVSPSNGNDVINVFDNDSGNGAQPIDGDFDATILSPAAPINGGLVPTLDPATGLVDVPPGTPPGEYQITYEICLRLDPSVCDSTTVTINVTAFVDLSVTKTNTPGVNGEVDQTDDIVTSGTTSTYVIMATNNGPDFAFGSVVSDSIVSGLTCDAANAVTISGDGVPSGSFTVADLTGSGITLGTLENGQSTQLSYDCIVN